MMTDAAAERDRGGGGVGPSRVYVCPQRDQMFLLPVSMRDWLWEGDLVWFVLDAVEQLDTGALHRCPGWSAGRPPYQPEMMCALVLYAYCRGMRSSRVIEAACRTDVAFRVICGGLEPDHATIARFVVDHERALEGLFVEGLRLCAAAGLVDVSVVALDGTKVAADASLARNRDAQWIRGEVSKLMALTGADQQPDGAGGLPGLQAQTQAGSLAGRKARLQAALAVILAEDGAAAAAAQQQARAAAEQARHGRHLAGRKPKTQPLAALARAEVDYTVARERVQRMQAERATKLTAAAERGHKPTGPPYPSRIARAQDALGRAQAALAAAQAAVAAAPATATRANVTDPDSRIMKTKDGWVQGYNAQAIVNRHHIVLACELSQDGGDVGLYRPMTSQLERTLKSAGVTAKVELVLADAGYWSEANATSPGPDRLIATTKDHKQRKAARELGRTDGPPPPNATPIQEMEHLLRTPQGAAAYAQRSCLIEPVFGDRKHNRGLRTFRRRGINAARSEWAFSHLAGNLLKLYQHHAASAAT